MTMIRERLAALRAGMKEAGIDWYIVPSGDCHCSEYLSDYFRTVRFISGFTGSAGTVLIGKDRAYLWTDGRYFIQAERELAGSGIELMRMAQAGVPTVTEFLKAEVKDGETLGFDGRMTSAKLAAEWEEKAFAGRGIRLAMDRDLIGEIWSDRPAQRFSTPFLLPERFTGRSAADKIAAVREKMKEAGATLHFLSALDDIAWLLNLRADDVPNNPVVFGFVKLTEDEAVLYCRKAIFPAEIANALAAQGVSLQEYEEIWSEAEKIGPKETVLYDPMKTACRLAYAIGQSGANKITKTNPTTLMKCVKNPTEQEALRESHRKDGLAMVKWLYWLKHHPDPESLSEIDVSDYLEKCRRQEGAFELSFGTIAAMGPNAAMMHYSATPQNYAMIQKKGFLLVDSGGQYPDGTTDITRTVAMGPLTENERLHYTAVLRSFLRLGMAKFLKGSTCYFLDILARGPVWDLGIDYRCGTGHGVGFCLNVHEGPNGFRWTKPAALDGLVELQPGMVTTDEPGVYIEGGYGIRIENELLCVTDEENEYGQFYRFEHLTVCPIDLTPVMTELLAPDEKKALNAYHAMVYERLKSGLSGEEAAWLKEITAPI